MIFQSPTPEAPRGLETIVSSKTMIDHQWPPSEQPHHLIIEHQKTNYNQVQYKPPAQS